MAKPTPLEIIRQVPLFSVLTDEQVKVLADAVVKRSYRRGEIVVERGKQANALFVLLSGRARVVVTDDGLRQVILAQLHPGDYVGEMSLIDARVHSATVRAEVATDVLILGKPEFARCLPANSSLAYAILRGLVQRLRGANDQIESLALLDVHGRVARALMDMSENVEGATVIRRKVVRQDVAELVGASREMVSRVMTSFETRGLMQTQANGSVIIKRELYEVSSLRRPKDRISSAA
jgi:CRP/FNR family cyclic AMP-dependent transcriptional regulator